MDNFWKDKKIIAYVALLHHTRFIIPVMERLSQLGADVRYVVAQAERSQEITAVECNLDYTHIFEYLSNDDFNDIQENYLRQRNVFSQALSTDFVIGTQILTVMDKTLYASAQEYIGFRNMLRQEKPHLCFALHEVNRWGKMFSFWAKKYNIPFITLQEGLGYDENYGYIGHVQYSTLDLVWGERIRKKFSDYEAPIERIIPVGNTHISREKEYQETNDIRSKMRKKLDLNKKFVPLLILSLSLPEKEKIYPLLEELHGQSHLKLVIKFHPACKYSSCESWKESIPERLKKNVIFIHGSESTYDLMSASDVCVLARPSTTGIESIALGKPLVQLDLHSDIDTPYSFVEQGVALDMKVNELANALIKRIDFSKEITPEAIDLFLKNELTETTGATDRIVEILKKTISANLAVPSPSIRVEKPISFDWSFIIPVAENAPDQFLFQLQNFSQNSEGLGTYEVILVEPESLNEKTSQILDSLTGDIIRIKLGPEDNFFTAVNKKVLPVIAGEKLVFTSELDCPLPNWLKALNNGFSKYGTKKIFGGKLINKFENIVHAGMVMNVNNAPVSAYLHLDSRFVHANKERPFLMVDYVVALSRDFFAELGGFSPNTGTNAYMDICLKAHQLTKDESCCIYLPQMEFLKNSPTATSPSKNAIHFYAKWHGMLWDNEDRLYEDDGISPLQLDAARMTRAQELANRI
ncbi:MAG: hypothetical protein MI892_07820 [Desulfobacterales bacterium]|nr:hypothetical protein [Desulfobacterales bacterium]